MDIATLSASASKAQALLKVLANKNRLMILCALQEGELSVTSLNKQVALSQSALSQHLALLRKEKIVVTRKESKTVYYRVENTEAQAILATLYHLYCEQ